MLDGGIAVLDSGAAGAAVAVAGAAGAAGAAAGAAGAGATDSMARMRFRTCCSSMQFFW